MRKIVVAIITLSLIFTMMPGKDIKASDTNDVTLVKKCIEAGITPVMITGDQLLTAKVIATRLGIFNDNNKAVDGNMLDKLSDEELKKEIANVVSTLKEREQTVIKMRFGLEDFTKTTLEDIGKIFGVTKECIRQTELRALKKMKLSGATLLSCYIG